MRVGLAGGMPWRRTLAESREPPPRVQTRAVHVPHVCGARMN